MFEVVYEIDDCDRIVATSSAWKEFARANGGHALEEANLVGRSVFDFISGAAVREVYAAVIAKARDGRPVRFRYRCDGPVARREFEMKVVSTAPDRLTFISTLLREARRPAVALFDPASRSTRRLLRMCSWCHAIANDSGQWQPLETAIAALGLMQESGYAGVTHSICPACSERMFGILRAEN